MRPLTEEETKTMFEKLSKYIGDNIKLLIDRSDGAYCFRLHKDRVYYVSEKIMKQVKYITFLRWIIKSNFCNTECMPFDIIYNITYLYRQETLQEKI